MKISEVPMLTADECEIEVNGVLYDYTFANGYNFKGEAKADIIAYRVISVNESARHFRVRCPKGCEVEHSYSKGCSSTKLYGKIASVKERIAADFNEDMGKCIKKAEAVDKTKKAILSELRRVNGLKSTDVKIPRAVRIN